MERTKDDHFLMIVRKELSDTHMVLSLVKEENHELRAWQVGVRLRVSLDLQAKIERAVIRCVARKLVETNARPKGTLPEYLSKWDTAVERLYDYSTFIDMAQDMLKGLLS